MNDEATLATEVKAELRANNRVLEEFNELSRKEMIPVCLTCAKFDLVKSKLKDYREYTKGFKELKKDEAWITPKAGVPAKKYILIDYVCPHNHGVSMHFEAEEYENKFNKKINKEVRG